MEIRPSTNLLRERNHINFTFFIVSNCHPNSRLRAPCRLKKSINQGVKLYTRTTNDFCSQPLRLFVRNFQSLGCPFPIGLVTHPSSKHTLTKLPKLATVSSHYKPPWIKGKTNFFGASVLHPVSRKLARSRRERSLKALHFTVSSLNEFPNASYSAMASSSGGIHLGLSTVTQVAITAAAVVYGAYLSEGLLGRRNVADKPDPVIIEGVDVTRYKIFNEKQVQKAIKFASSAHSGQMRKTGEPYITHCIQTAKILAALVPSSGQKAVETIVAAILHDIVDDTTKKLEDIKNEFGENVCSLVEDVSKLSSITQLLRRTRRWNAEKNETNEKMTIKEFENLRRMTLRFVNDPRVVLIKLADRLHNMRTIYALPPPKARAVAQETLAVWCSLASRLGVMAIKAELEDLCFAVLQPRTFRRLRAELAKIWSSPSNWRQMRRELRKDPNFLSKNFSFKTVTEDDSGDIEEDVSMEDLLRAVIPFDVLLERRNVKARTFFSNGNTSDQNVKDILNDSQIAISALIACEEVLVQELLISTSYIPGMEITPSGRLKSLYSTHSKMKRKNTSVDKVFDARALRVVIGDDDGKQSFFAIECCYSLLSDIHNLWTPIDGEYDDYIINPKPSGYQSLHTAVIGPDGAPLEIQIRTKSMHDYAEFGHAAHWLYKETDTPPPSTSTSPSLPSSLTSFSFSNQSVLPSITSPTTSLSPQASPPSHLSSSSSSTSTSTIGSSSSSIFAPYSVSSDSLSLQLSTKITTPTSPFKSSSTTVPSLSNSASAPNSSIPHTTRKSPSLENSANEFDFKIHQYSVSRTAQTKHAMNLKQGTDPIKSDSSSIIVEDESSFSYDSRRDDTFESTGENPMDKKSENKYRDTLGELENEFNEDVGADTQESNTFRKNRTKSKRKSKEPTYLNLPLPVVKVGYPALRILGGKLLNAVIMDIEENGKRLLVATHFGFSAREIMCSPRSVTNKGKWIVFSQIFNTVSGKWWHSPGHGDFEICLERFKLCKDGIYHLEDHFGRALKTFLQPIHLSEEEEREYFEIMKLVKEGKEVIDEESDLVERNSSNDQRNGIDSSSANESSNSSSSSVNHLNEKVRLLRSMLQWEQEIRHESVPNGSVTILDQPSSDKSESRQTSSKSPEKQIFENLASDILVILCPSGEIISLPFGSTALDAITRFGTGRKMVWVNGKVALLNTVLRDGDFIEI